ncbi:MAG: hypothetical protein EA382_12950 [Spirochaetaceae bacterium]|nr:MAG: hypothetical protein EA382_12950 [Spirochaetaceae bacterium]
MRFLALSLVTIVALTACSDPDDYFVGRSDVQARELYELVATESDPQVRAVAIEQLAAHLLIDAGQEPLIVYLTTLLQRNPDDPFGGLYTFIVAQSYLESNAHDLARHYFQRVVRRFPDIEVRGTSLHRQSIEHLVRLSVDPEERIGYYRRLLAEFPDTLDRGLIHYRLAEAYSEVGAWSSVYTEYRNFLRYPKTVVPGVPNAHREIARRVAFYDSPKNWTRPTLADLHRDVARALHNRDAAGIRRLQAGVNFFTRSWEQDADDPNTAPVWDIGELLRQSRNLSVDRNVQLSTSGDEAYLWTFGWGALRIRTWYLYFRKVYYPPNPEIHGTWEWAGVYLGERI